MRHLPVSGFEYRVNSQLKTQNLGLCLEPTRTIDRPGKRNNMCGPRSEPRSERAQERKAAPACAMLGNRFVPRSRCALRLVSLQASSRHGTIARERRGSLLGALTGDRAGVDS